MTGELNPERIRHLDRYLCGRKILDAGCGGGAFVEFLEARDFEVTGVDYHEMFLEVARARPGATGTYVQGDIGALPFPDTSFYCTYCFDVLEHVDDQLALKELQRVTASRIIIAVPASDLNNFGRSLTFYHYQDLTHLRTYTRESLEILIKSLGLQHYKIVPELPVSVHALAIEQLCIPSTSNMFKAGARRAYHWLLRQMLRGASYRFFYSGWVAIIDLDPSNRPTAN